MCFFVDILLRLISNNIDMHALVCATDHASNSHTYRRKYHSKQAPKYTTTTNVQFYREKYDTYMSLIAHRFFSMLFQFIHFIWLVFSLGADDMNTVDCGIGSLFFRIHFEHVVNAYYKKVSTCSPVIWLTRLHALC